MLRTLQCSATRERREGETYTEHYVGMVMSTEEKEKSRAFRRALHSLSRLCAARKFRWRCGGLGARSGGLRAAWLSRGDTPTNSPAAQQILSHQRRHNVMILRSIRSHDLVVRLRVNVAAVCLCMPLGRSACIGARRWSCEYESIRRRGPRRDSSIISIPSRLA